MPYDPTQPSDYDAYIKEMADEFDIPHDSFRKLLFTESSFNPNAVSPAGAKGIAQFMPKTGASYGLNTDEDFFNPTKSIQAAANYLSDLKGQYKGNWAAAVAHYNGGTSQGKLVASGQKPTKEETLNYVDKIGVFTESVQQEPSAITSSRDIINSNVQGVYEEAGIEYSPASSVNDLPYDRDLFKRNNVFDTAIGSVRSEKEIANEAVNILDSVRLNSTLGTWVDLAAMRLARYSVDGDYFGRNTKLYRPTPSDLDLLTQKYGSLDSPAAQWVLRNTVYEGDFENLVARMDEQKEYNQQVANSGIGNTLVNMTAEAVFDPLNAIPLGIAFQTAGKGATFAGRVFNSQLAAKLGWWSAMAGVGGSFGAASEGLRQYTTGTEMNIRDAFIGGALMISAFHGLGALSGKSAQWLRDSATRAELIETGTRIGKDLGQVKGMSGSPVVGKVINNLNKKTIARWEAIKKIKPKMTLQEWTEASDSELVKKFGRLFYPDEIGRPTAGYKISEKDGVIGTKRGDTGEVKVDLDDGTTYSQGTVEGDTRAASKLPADEMVNVHRDADTIFDTRQRLIGEVNYYREQFARAVKRSMSKLGMNFNDTVTAIYHAGQSGTISKLPEPLQEAAYMWKESMEWIEEMLKDSSKIAGKENLPNILSERAGRNIPEDGFYVPVRSDGEKVENLVNTIGKERTRAIEDLQEEMANNLWEGVISNEDKFKQFKDIIDTAWMEHAAKDPNYKTPIDVLQKKWKDTEAKWKAVDKELTNLRRQDQDLTRQIGDAKTVTKDGTVSDPKEPTQNIVTSGITGQNQYSEMISSKHKLVSTKTMKDTLDEMLKSGALGERHTAVAEMLKRIIDPAMVIHTYDRPFKITPGGGVVGGFYHPVTNDIHMPPGDNYQTMLHEMFHAVTARRLILVNQGKGTRLQTEAKWELEHILYEAKTAFFNEFPNAGYQHWSISIDELLSEGFVNPQLVEFLKKTKSVRGKETFRTRIIRSLAKLFGIGKDEATMLDDFFASTEKLLKGRSDIKYTGRVRSEIGPKIPTKHPVDKDFQSDAVIKGLDEFDGLSKDDIAKLRKERAAIRRKISTRQKNLDKYQKELDTIGAYEDIPNKVYSEELTDRAYKSAYGYLNRRLDDRNFWDSNGGFDEMSPYEQRIPWDVYYKGKDSNFSVSDILDTKMMDIYDGYMNRTLGDLSVLNTTGSTDGFNYLKGIYDEAARTIPESNKNRERELRAMKMMVYQAYGLPVTGVSKSGARATKSFVEGMLDTATNMGLFTKNAAFGIMNYFETAAGIRAYGTSFFFKNIPAVGKLLKRLERGKASADDLRLLENMTFHKDIGETLFWPREMEKNLEKYNNKFIASLVTGSKMLANNSPLTQFMYHSQNTIVSTARQELLAEMTRFVHGGDLNPRGFFTPKHLKRLGLTEKDLEHTFEALKKMTFMDKNGSPRISEDYFDHMTPKFQHQLGIIGEYVANEVIQRETPGSMFLWKGGSHNAALTLLLQFKSFALKSINKRLIKAGNRYAYEGDKDFVYEYFIDSALQSLQTLGLVALRANAISDPEKKKKYIQRQYGVDEFSWKDMQDPDFLYHAAIKGMYDRNSRLAGLSLVTGALGLTSDAAKTTISTERAMRQNASDVTRAGKIGNKVAGYIPAVGYIQDTFDLGASAYNLAGSAVGAKNLTPKEKERQAGILWDSIKNTIMPNDPMFIAHLINFAKEHHKEALRD